jgi:hypothetical protein
MHERTTLNLTCFHFRWLFSNRRRLRVHLGKPVIPKGLRGQHVFDGLNDETGEEIVPLECHLANFTDEASDQRVDQGPTC